MSKKKMKVYYYWSTVTKNNNTKLLNLSRHLERIQQMELKDRFLKLGEENLQLKTISKENNLWKLVFLRNRNDSPYISKIDDEGKPLHLEDDEFVGNEVCAIYDENLCIMTIQNNKNSASYNTIAAFFIEFIRGLGGSFQLTPITYIKEYSEISDDELKQYKSLILSFTDLSDIMSIPNKEKDDAIQSINLIASNLNALNGKVELSVGNKKDHFLDKMNLKSIIKFFKKNSEKTKTLKVRMLDNDTIRTIDLISNKVYDDIEIEVSKSDPKTFEKILSQMEIKMKYKLENEMNIINDFVNA